MCLWNSRERRMVWCLIRRVLGQLIWLNKIVLICLCLGGRNGRVRRAIRECHHRRLEENGASQPRQYRRIRGVGEDRMKKYRQRPRIGNMYVPICICCQDIMFGSDANELLMLDLCIKTGFKLIPRGSRREREQRGLSIESIPAWCECVSLGLFL